MVSTTAADKFSRPSVINPLVFLPLREFKKKKKAEKKHIGGRRITKKPWHLFIPVHRVRPGHTIKRPPWFRFLSRVFRTMGSGWNASRRGRGNEISRARARCALMNSSWIGIEVVRDHCVVEQRVGRIDFAFRADGLALSTKNLHVKLINAWGVGHGRPIECLLLPTYRWNSSWRLSAESKQSYE